VTEEAPKERKSGEQCSPTAGNREALSTGGGWKTMRTRTPITTRWWVIVEVVVPMGSKCQRWWRGAQVWGISGHGNEKKGKCTGVAVLVVEVENEFMGSKMSTPEMSALGQKWVLHPFFVQN
jgi:hypothetical protein